MITDTTRVTPCPTEDFLRSLIATAPGDDWYVLVEQIAELEEMLAEVSAACDHDAEVGRPALERLLGEKRSMLRLIDVG